MFPACAGSTEDVSNHQASGPLRVHQVNPRYFTDGGGKVIYLAGSHTWDNLQDRGPEPHPNFDYSAYLGKIRTFNHNLIRLWAWEQAAWAPWTHDRILFSPLPYPRLGPGTALDGGLKFDLTKFDESYFDRLRSRVVAAGDQGIYVAVMLFQGWSIESKGNLGNPWRGHPYHSANNINGINGDPDAKADGTDVHTLKISEVRALQEEYVRKVIDTLNDLDNVLYEISNESGSHSTDWQYHMIRFIKAYEATKPKQHPVGMTFQYGPDMGKNQVLFDSPADWISPNAEGGYGDSPPAADGRKVILNDTDHIWGIGGSRQWVWSSFLSGLNPIFMDDFGPDFFSGSNMDEITKEEIRRAMGHTLILASSINLVELVPSPHLSSTKFCLAKPGHEYLTYLPEGGSVKVTLEDVPQTYTVEWLSPDSKRRLVNKTDKIAGPIDFTAPFDGEAVLHVYARD
jgi:hypothetical protein